MGKATTALIAFVAGVVVTAAFLRARPVSEPLNAEFLADHYDLVLAAERVVRARELESDVLSRRKLVADRWVTFLDPAFAPSVGDRFAATVLVEFTDYACEPCRASAPAVQQTLSSHPNVRMALFLLPTSGELSEYAARVAFAAYRQNPDRFATLHERLLRLSGPLTSAAILRAAQDAGFDPEQLEVDLRSSEVRQYIARTAQFAQDLQVAGVPFFLLNGRILAGGVSQTKLNSFVGP